MAFRLKIELHFLLPWGRSLWISSGFFYLFFSDFYHEKELTVYTSSWSCSIYILSTYYWNKQGKKSHLDFPGVKLAASISFATIKKKNHLFFIIALCCNNENLTLLFKENQNWTTNWGLLRMATESLSYF